MEKSEKTTEIVEIKSNNIETVDVRPEHEKIRIPACILDADGKFTSLKGLKFELDILFGRMLKEKNGRVYAVAMAEKESNSRRNGMDYCMAGAVGYIKAGDVAISKIAFNIYCGVKYVKYEQGYAPVHGTSFVGSFNKVVDPGEGGKYYIEENKVYYPMSGLSFSPQEGGFALLFAKRYGLHPNALPWNISTDTINPERAFELVFKDGGIEVEAARLQQAWGNRTRRSPGNNAGRYGKKGKPTTQPKFGGNLNVDKVDGEKETVSE